VIRTSSVGGAHRIVYKWLPDNKWLLALVLFLLLEAPLLVNYVGIVGWDDFNLIDYPAFLIVSFFLSYLVALAVFNKTTTTITDTTFSVTRGPIPCLWPGNHHRSVQDVQLISYARQRSIVVNGNMLYYFFVTFKDGKQASLFTIINDEKFAMELATRVRDWIAAGQTEKAVMRSGITRSGTFPPDRAQRLKVVACALAVLVALAGMIVTTEFLASKYRPTHQAKRREQQFGMLQKGLRSPANYAVAIPERWHTFAHPGKPSVDLVYEGHKGLLNRRMSEVFEAPKGRIRLEVKGMDTEYVSGTPCGSADYVVFPIAKNSLQKDAAGMASVNISTFKTSTFQPRLLQEDNTAWLCF